MELDHVPNNEASPALNVKPNSELKSEEESVDADNEGVIRINSIHELNKKTPVSRQKKSNGLCKQTALSLSKCKRESNFLNLSAEEIEGIKSRNAILAVRKEAEFRKMYSSYITGVIGDEGIMSEMNNVIAKHDYMMAKKRWALHQCWQKDVFENINDQVEKKLKTLTKDQIKDRIRYFHYQYMNASNNRHLFLDILDNSFYNPFESLKYTVKYKSNFRDPLKHDQDKEDNETLLRKGRVSKGAKVRKTLDFHDWQYSMFRSTIWGHVNADEEDGSHVHVRNSPNWISNDLLYNNTKIPDTNSAIDWFPGGRCIVPNQGKGWSFLPKPEGKKKVYGLDCLTQPKLQLYYT